MTKSRQQQRQWPVEVLGGLARSLARNCVQIQSLLYSDCLRVNGPFGWFDLARIIVSCLKSAGFRRGLLPTSTVARAMKASNGIRNRKFLTGRLHLEHEASGLATYLGRYLGTYCRGPFSVRDGKVGPSCQHLQFQTLGPSNPSFCWQLLRLRTKYHSLRALNQKSNHSTSFY